ncbi:MarR family winged helix-turn-helix transcriptional regulator [Streptomyces aurantiacus]|uniref:MarR family transcriptional regulator n=1 Tax=Streptomyces aurantiacus TaxID=47760 RepID=A0A7G1P738_9ACTN|nr:MarR family transcriptional regulator [Streptomyces aurantiacus]BCL29646.1 MarR family transcriptional regulator [Streptomyces aurantiacus]
MSHSPTSTDTIAPQSPAMAEQRRHDSELRYLLLAAQREGARQMTGQLKPLNLTPAQAEILLVLAERAPLTLAELGRLIVCESGSPSRIVDTLTKRGLVDREPGQVDRRVVHLRLTSRGEELMPVLRTIDARTDAMIVDRLSAEEQAVMTRGLRRILDGTPSGTALAARFGREK